MEPTDWTPANPTEQEMADALAARDSAQYARILARASLYIPDLPEPGSDEERLVAEILPPGVPHVITYTSPETLSWALGGLARGWQRLDFETLRQRWTDPRQQLAVNPGSPIGVFLPPRAVADLAEGKTSLASIEETSQQVMTDSLALVRQVCLQELGGGGAGSAAPGNQPGQPGQPGASGAGEVRDDPPANELEAALRDAAGRSDSHDYLEALLSASVLLPTTAPVAGPDDLYEDDFPWLVAGKGQLPTIPLFTSGAMLERAAGPGQEHIEALTLDIVANWPGERHALCVNPGTTIELILPGTTVREIVSALAESLLEPAREE